MDPIEQLIQMVALRQDEGDDYGLESENIRRNRSQLMKHDIERTRDWNPSFDVWYPPNFSFPKEEPAVEEDDLDRIAQLQLPDPRLNAIESMVNSRNYPTRYQQHLFDRMNRGERLQGREALDAHNRSFPPEYGDEGYPHEDDILGY